jgi:hypothetical protein
VIVDDEKRVLDYSKLVEIYVNIDDEDDTYEIILTISDGKNKVLNTNKNFQLLDVSTDLTKFTQKDKKQLNTSLARFLIRLIVPYSMI